MIYQISKNGELARDFALRDQIRRAAISVMSNIAEGFERKGSKDFAYFLRIAKASCAEVNSQLYLAGDLGYCSQEQCETAKRLANETSRVIAGLRNKVVNFQE